MFLRGFDGASSEEEPDECSEVGHCGRTCRSYSYASTSNVKRMRMGGLSRAIVSI